jgi:hypothetical protein
MKIVSWLLSGVATLAFLALATPTFAAESKGKEMKITGECKCAKCALKETDKCQNVVEVEKDGTKEKYYIVQDKVGKDFHENVCKETKKVVAVGTLKKVDGKNEFTATKIEILKE